jgi:hypothetical protein
VELDGDHNDAVIISAEKYERAVAEFLRKLTPVE